LFHLSPNVVTLWSLLHLRPNVITFRSLLHLRSVITFRSSTAGASLLTGSSHELQSQENKYDAISMINLFYKNIACGPEYVCTCWDQLWFKCSVVRCGPNKYRACSLDIIESCITGFKSVNDTEWNCMTCNKKKF